MFNGLEKGIYKWWNVHCSALPKAKGRSRDRLARPLDTMFFHATSLNTYALDLRTYVCIWMFVCINIYIYIYTYLCFYSYIFNLSIYFCIYMSICLSVYLICVSIHLSTIFMYLSIHPSIYQNVYIDICTCIYVCVCAPVWVWIPLESIPYPTSYLQGVGGLYCWPRKSPDIEIGGICCGKPSHVSWWIIQILALGVEQQISSELLQ